MVPAMKSLCLKCYKELGYQTRCGAGVDEMPSCSRCGTRREDRYMCCKDNITIYDGIFASFFVLALVLIIYYLLGL